MAVYDYDFEKYYGVREYVEGEKLRVDPKLIVTSVNALESLVHSRGFTSILVATEDQSITYFLSKEMAEEFQDAIISDRIN